MSALARDVLQFPAESRDFLESYLPPPDHERQDTAPLPFTTVTFATSLDSQLALQPGAPTALSGPQSKAMTHYLRSRHDAILIGRGTAEADNPSLNCRISGAGGYGGAGLDSQPRPIVIDPHLRWDFTAAHKVFQLAQAGRGKAPYIITRGERQPMEKHARILEDFGGKYITVSSRTDSSDEGCSRLAWSAILQALQREGLQSVMIEGGASVINSLLGPESLHLITSVIVTVAPTWLGRGGVVVSPDRRLDEELRPIPAARLGNVVWHPLGEDVVLCGNMRI